MNCKKCQRLYLLSLDGQLSHSLKREMEQHINQCPTCQKEIQQIKEISSELEREEKILPADEILQDIRHRAYQRPSSLKKKPFFVIPKIHVALPRLAYALAVTVGIAIIISVFLPREESIPIRVVDTKPHFTLPPRVTKKGTKNIEKYFNDQYVAGVREKTTDLFTVVEEARNIRKISSKKYVFSFSREREDLETALKNLKRRVEKELDTKKYTIN